MTEEAFLALIDPVLRAAGATPEPGEEFHAPALDILRYYGRSVRLNFVPILGSAVSVVVVARQPMDVGFSTGDQTRFLTRLAMAVNGRYPPWGLGGHPKGLAVGMTAVILTPEPIGPGDEAVLASIVSGKRYGLRCGRELRSTSASTPPSR